MNDWIKTNTWGSVAQQIIEKIRTQIELLDDLGLGHLTLDRSAKSLRASEIQRIRVANQILVPLSDVLYVFDEPSIGLHRTENKRLIHHLKQLVSKGNTVIVVEHNLNTIRSADQIIEIGPKAGVNGGELIYNGTFSNFVLQENLEKVSATYRAIKGISQVGLPARTPALKGAHHTPPNETASIHLFGCYERNLNNINVEFKLGKLNVVSGRSGVGKSSLVKGTLLKAVRQQLKIPWLPTVGEVDSPAKLTGHKNLDAINKLIFIDHTPIGKTPRSNPATYLGISDHIRDLFASLPAAKAKDFTKSRFSFNNKGGCCETCQGAGKTQIGMHFLGNIDLVCGTCNGDRFNAATLEIKYLNHSIADIYKLSINEALTFFDDQKKIKHGLQILAEIGLGYLTLGQSSTTLSGGEAQRIKIANQLQKKDTGNTLYVIIEPSIGLHHDDLQQLFLLFERIKKQGNTIVCIEQNEAVIGWSDWHIQLGSELELELEFGVDVEGEGIDKIGRGADFNEEILLNGVTTHGLKNIDVRIPKHQLTVVTGVSGSGKSSLVYDTLFAESNARFTESLSTYHRSFLQQNSAAKIASFSGLGPAIGINRKGGTPSKRSTVGTLSGVYDAYRLLYARIAQQEGEIFTAQHFSFNHHLGACLACAGLGVQRTCDPDQVVVAREESIFSGAISTNKAMAYYADLNGQFMATLQELAKQKDWNLARPWSSLETKIQNVILYGTGDTLYSVTWKYSTKSRAGTQVLNAKWLGFCHYISEEYQRKLHNKNIQHLEAMMHEVVCPSCQGSRLKPELLNTKFLEKNIFELAQLPITLSLKLLEEMTGNLDPIVLAISKVVLPGVKKSLQTLVDLGLGYLNLDRAVRTLSGGERQRVTLASQLSTHLFGVLYVLDEPTIGLDAAQVAVLSKVLKTIVNNGNTVVVVEHHPDFIQTADYLIEMGPGAGRLGGEVIYQGSVAKIDTAKQSITYQLLHTARIPWSKTPKTKGLPFGIKGAFANNLKNIDVDFYGGQMTAITGVSGSGKSSLMKEVLYRSWQQKRPVGCTSVHGLEQFTEVLLIDQTALPQNRLSTPLSYTGILELIKTAFAKTTTAKEAGFKKADFSYQSKNGKCPSCAGHGQLKTSMDFLSDIWLTCDRCQGMRYNKNILTCKLNDRSIGEILQMTAAEAMAFFESGPIVEKLKILHRVGVGHLLLGQPGNTLSGGEAQRLKLATAMLEKRAGARLFLFDEPSTGLHYLDVVLLIKVFEELVKNGDTVIFVEHDTTFIDAADLVLWMGPGSGEGGGGLVGL